MDKGPAMSPLCRTQDVNHIAEAQNWKASHAFHILSSMGTILLPLDLKVTSEQTLAAEVTEGHYLLSPPMQPDYGMWPALLGASGAEHRTQRQPL